MQPAADALLLRELMDRSGVMIAAIDKQGILIACNETVCRNAGRARDELVGRNISGLRISFPVHTPEQWRDILRRIEAETEVAVETELGRRDGSLYRARLSLSFQEH